MKIVFLDAQTVGTDVDLSGFEALGEVVRYEYSAPEQVPERIGDAEVIIVNKVPVNEQTIGAADHLKLVCVTATGTNNLDKEYLDQRGIKWHNVAGYSTETVAQHTFALLFYLMEKLRYYDDYVKSGDYAQSPIFTHFDEAFTELSGKTWGIIGLGAIGRRVAQIAQAFGARVIYYSASGSKPQDGYEQVDFDTLLATSDIISVHAPLNAYTQNLMNRVAFGKMKPTCIFLNLGRGPIVVEQDLYEALRDGEIAAAGLDVLCEEPIAADHPLLQITDSRKLIITPHIAWASVEARQRLMQMVLGQVRAYVNGSGSARCERAMMRLYAVTDRAWVGRQSLYEQVEAALRGGVTCVQLREKDLDAEAFLEEAKQIRALCHSYQVPFIINDNVDIALAVGADGVHVGQDDMSVADVRRRVGDAMMIGVSAHSVEEALRAQEGGADYLGVGAMFTTATKTNVSETSGETLREICQTVQIPVVAIGGISEQNMMQLAGLGMDGVALVSAIFAADDIEAACRRLDALVGQII